MTCPRWLRVVWSHSPTGPRIAYTVAQVAARRAAQMVLVVGCTAGAAGAGLGIAHYVPASWIGLPPVVSHEPAPPVWRATGEPAQRVPEPPTWPLLAIGIVGLVAVRNWKRHGRADWFVAPKRVRR